MNKKGKNTIRRKAVIKAVLKSLESGGSISAACRVNKITFMSFWRWRKEDKSLDKEVDQIIKDRVKIVEDALFQQAVDPKGPPVLKIFYLCNRAPDKWKNVQRIDHTGSIESNVKVYVTKLKAKRGDDNQGTR